LVGTSAIARFGSFDLDGAQRRLTRAGNDVHLTPKALDLLLLLAETAPGIVSKREIHERIWTGTFVSDATLVGLVKELRRALHDGAGPSMIRTAHGVGYALAATVERVTSSSGRPSLAQHWLVANGTRLPLREGPNAIGRDPQSDVWLNSTSVSRHHARVLVEADAATVEDVGSKNGTRLGGAILNGSVPLHDGDVLSIGSITVVYRTSSSGVSTETGASRAGGRTPGTDFPPAG
jgi:DNA-binding winged helix-turn-helix (wHTH) protein